MAATMRKWTADIDPATIPDEVLKSERARRNSLRRQTYGGGRPPARDRCPCGLMTRARAKQRNHQCVPASA